MRILFLDDNEERHKAFMRANIGNNVDHVWSAREAIEAIDLNEPYDVASLDHDLDWKAQAGMRPLEETGMVVAHHIASMPKERQPRQVIVHSFNPVGGKNMFDLLVSAGVNVARGPWQARRY
jgi:CheY-like chemotaxis protein